MSWVSSTIGVVCLAFTEFQFTQVFFFRPLIIVMMVTYYMGCYTLPALLTYIDIDVCRLGKLAEEEENTATVPTDKPSEVKLTDESLSGGMKDDVPPDEPERAVVVDGDQHSDNKETPEETESPRNDEEAPGQPVE